MLNRLPFYSSRYALIKDGVVTNVIMADSYPTAGMIGEAHGADEVVEVSQFAVSIGDQYIDGVFYHEGNEVERQLTLEEENERLKQLLADLTEVVLLGGMPQ